ncbi:substrate-binding domain-containing protein [Halalkalicoccus sp. NIPERK01]|uniref:substrate-binding domain-containing protein n=1 Tax=Halalkalicoccus sp. NIPERK01 TaxID=3053469 RepID=UPI00256EC88B|nr:substrate-binding domain-containing protein [Halalkalicoccus sp. NIPERK01]MDL5362971.1 substrate-binding domain-containing protein [Halalkalicoccus sp. NIPERK01]
MAIQRRDFLALAGGGVAAGLAGCTGVLSGGEGDSGNNESGSSGGSIAGQELVLATTTSTYDTGLLDEVNAAFEENFGTPVQAISQGTGAALETARSGDCDVVMVHARSQEDEFMRNGHGINRRDLMFNDFVIVGPGDDPAGIGGSGDALAAFQAIAESGSLFASRGDDSGTHTAERRIWEAAGVDPGGEWYLETGQGMGDTLNQASQQGAYTLSDRGTFISQREEIELEILVQGPVEGGPEILANPYGVLAINPAVHGDVNYQLAMSYIGFLTSPEGQDVIENYELDGEQLFFPQALSEDPNFGQYVPEGWRPEGEEGGTDGE